MIILQYVGVGSKTHILHEVHLTNLSISSYALTQQHISYRLHGGDLDHLMGPQLRTSMYLSHALVTPSFSLCFNDEIANDYVKK